MFRDAGQDGSDLDARILVGAACNFDHAALIRDPQRPLGDAASTLAGYARRRLAHEPVSRIIGWREFWGLRLAVNAAVLDPRPETEGLVASALDALGGRRDAPLRILDLGTGSGAILAALLTELPSGYGVGVDRSPAACRVAVGNLSRLGLSARSHVVCGSWADMLRARFDLVVSNPPYIPDGEITSLSPDVRNFDPRAALAGGADGLEAYRAIISRLNGLLAPGGVIAFECGWNQGGTIAAMLAGAGLQGLAVYKDLAGHERVVLGTL